MNSEEQKRREEWLYSNVNVELTLIFIIFCTDRERSQHNSEEKSTGQLTNQSVTMLLVNMQFSYFLWGCIYLYQAVH